MNDDEIVGEARFRFSSRFSQLIGRNLISNPIVAVSELVKNAYDADADNILVSFENLNESGKELLKIIDDGDGMSFNDLTEKWLVVGTDNKVVNKYTSKNRRKLGEKGIGRFSVERLASKITIITTQKDMPFALKMSIDWDEYEISTGEFSDKKHQIIKMPFDKTSQGTQLILEGLRDVWDNNGIFELRKELNLIRPININKMSYKKYHFLGDNVKISLQAEELGINNKVLDLGFIEYHQAHLFGEIKKDKSAKIRVEIKPSISMTKDSVDETFEYLYPESPIDISCGPVSFEIFVFFKDRRLYKSLDIDKDKFDLLLGSYSGVKIYRDGFRILPFGDQDDDWLELNAKRTSSPEHRIGTMNAVGIVNITRDDNPGLQDVLSRENMYDTVEFAALKKFVNLAFEKYTNMQLIARKASDQKKQEKGKEALEYAQKSVKDFSKQIGSFQKKIINLAEIKNQKDKENTITNINNQLNKLLNSAETSLRTVKTAYSYYRLQDSFKTREIQIYRNIATLGISAAMFGHEALNRTTHAKIICQTIIEDNLKTLNQISNELGNCFLNLQEDIILIDEKADFFRNYLRREKQDRARYINLKEMANDILNQYKKAFASIKVNTKVVCKLNAADVTMWGYEGDFETIFTNLVTNAYKALKLETEAKYLYFSIEREGDKIIILSKNNGNPIDKENRAKIFEPLFTTFSDGTGLGLTIIQDTLISYRGTIILCDDYPETNFKITIPITKQPEDK